MRRSVYFSSLAALLAGTAVAGPQGVPPSAPARPSCCAGTPAGPAASIGLRERAASPVAAFAAVSDSTAAASAGAAGRGAYASPAVAAEAVAARGTVARASDASDSAAIDALIDTLYATVSGPAGSRRDWTRLARLHAPGARLHVTRAGADGALSVDSLDFDAFIALHEARFAERDFHEREIAREVAGFGGVRHVWSTFEARRHPDDAAPYARGVNSLQLARTPDGWRLLSATWDFETPDRPLPARIGAVAAEGAR